MNPFFESILSGKKFFDALTQPEQEELIVLGESYVKNIYQTNATQNDLLPFIQKLDTLLYKEEKHGFIKAQYLTNIFFHRLKTEKFDFNNPPANPLNIKLDNKTISLCNTKFFISQESINEIVNYAKNYYLTIHNETLTVEKIKILNNLITVDWAKDLDTHSVIQRAYKKERNIIDKIKRLVEVDNLENNIAPAKPSQKVKI